MHQHTKLLTNPRISYSACYTINLGNYENIKVEMGVEADGNPDDTTESTMDTLTKFVEHMLDKKCKELYSKAKPWMNHKRDD